MFTQLHENTTSLNCQICGGREFRQENVEEVFHVRERYVLVERIPATVCLQCGEKTFGADTAEDVRKMLNEGLRPQRVVEMDVFAYRSAVTP